MKVTKARDVLANLRKNAFSTWCGSDTDAPGPNRNYAANRLQGRFANVEVEKKFDLNKGGSVYAMGSCFAREIEAALVRTGFRVPSCNDYQGFDSETFSAPHSWGAQAFVNRFSTASMLLEIQRITGEIDLADDSLVLGSEKIVDLHFAGSCDPGDMSLTARRRRITKEAGAGILDADLVVLTLGLTEVWFDTQSGYHANIVPDLNALRRSDRFELHELDFDENLKNLDAIFEIIRRRNSKANYVVTVSPIPLQATFTASDVVVATTRSKSVLRAVAEAFCSRHDNVLYFPSYEIVMHSSPAHAWRGDRRHVTSAMADHVIKRFRICHGLLFDDEEQVVRLTGFSDDRISVEDSVPSGFVVYSDQINLHPFDSGAERVAAVRFQGISSRGLVRFTSDVHVAHADARSVRFEVAAYRRGTNELLSRAVRATEAMGTDTLELELADLHDSEIDIVLSTGMSNKEDPSSYAWASFRDARLSYIAERKRA